MILSPIKMPTNPRSSYLARRRTRIAVLMVLVLGVGAFASLTGVEAAVCEPSAATPAAATASAELAWAEAEPIPEARSELAAAVVGERIFVVGGFGGPSRVTCLDTATGTWTGAADLPLGVHHPGVTALDGFVYVAGGYSGPNHDDGAQFWAYDPAADTWERRADMPTSRGALGLAVFAGKIYAIGGAQDHLGGPVTGAVEEYDPATDVWQSRTEMLTPREHLAVVAGPDRIYAIGGRANGDEGDQFAAANEAYDPVTDQWEALAPLPNPRGGLTGVYVEGAAGQVVVLGGERGTTTYDAADAYDPAANAWTALPPLPTPRHGLASAAVGTTVYTITGSTKAGDVENTPVVEVLDVASIVGDG